MIENSNFSIKSILILCLCVYFLGAQNKAVEKTEPSVQPQKEALLDWRIFGGVGFGGRFGTRLKAVSDSPYLIKLTPRYVSGVAEAIIGTEFVFNNGNGFNVFMNIEPLQFSVGANYLYELTGAYKFAFMSGFDIGREFNETETGYYSPSFYKNDTVIRWNLSARYRTERQAISLNLKVPLFQTTITDRMDTPLYNEYTGVVISAVYSYFFKL